MIFLYKFDDNRASERPGNVREALIWSHVAAPDVLGVDITQIVKVEVEHVAVGRLSCSQ